jgi:hypothetical protein
MNDLCHLFLFTLSLTKDLICKGDTAHKPAERPKSLKPGITSEPKQARVRALLPRQPAFFPATYKHTFQTPINDFRAVFQRLRGEGKGKGIAAWAKPWTSRHRSCPIAKSLAPLGQPPMNASKRIAQVIEELNLPKNIVGVEFTLTDYESDKTIRFIKPEEQYTLEDHRKLNAAFASELQRRGATVRWIMVKIDDYFSFLAKYDLKNTPANRAQFISWLTSPEPKFTPTD